MGPESKSVHTIEDLIAVSPPAAVVVNACCCCCFFLCNCTFCHCCFCCCMVIDALVVLFSLLLPLLCLSLLLQSLLLLHNPLFVLLLLTNLHFSAMDITVVVTALFVLLQLFLVILVVAGAVDNFC